jgi:hypothetical protein
VRLNAAIARFYCRRLVRISISDADSIVFGRYSSASEALVQFLEYAGVADDDFAGPIASFVGPFVEWSKRKHGMALGLTNTGRPMAAATGGVPMWKVLFAKLWQNALWAGITAYRIRFERLDRSMRRENRDNFVEKSLDAKRQRTTLIADSSESNLRVVLAIQLSIDALRTLVRICRTARPDGPNGSDAPNFPKPSGAMKRAVAALDANLELALSFKDEWSN